MFFTGKRQLISTILYFLAILSFFNTNTLAAQPKLDNSLIELYKQAVEKYHSDEFDDAITLSLKIREQFPEEPAGIFALLTTYQTIMRNYRVKTYESEYDSLLNLSVEVTRKAIKKDKKSGLNYFYLGYAFGSRSIYYAQRNKWMSALKDGSQVMKNFHKALAYNPELYEAYYGMGLFKYWMGAKSKFLRMLPFAKDNRKDGIREIKLAIDKGEFVKTDGMYGLSAIYLNEKKYDDALQLLNKLYEHYPNNPTLHYRKGIILEKLHRWDDALNSFAALSELLKKAPYKCYSYQMECLYKQAFYNYQLGHYLATQKYCQEALNLEKLCDLSNELNGPNEVHSDIVKHIHQLNDEVQSLVFARASK